MIFIVNPLKGSSGDTGGKMRTINDNIKNQDYKKMYLIFGEETYLRKQYRDKLKDAITEGDTMNYSYFEGKGTDAGKIIEIADTLPFFAQRRLVVVENSGFFKNANETMINYIEKVPDSTIIVFVEEEVDKRGKLYKKVKELGYDTEMTVQSPATLEKWILGMISSNGKKISRASMDYFLSVCGNDMMNISREVEKLICYCMDKEVIETEDIKEITTEQVSAKIFDMIDALGYKNSKKTLELYYDLIATKEPPMRILFMLARQFNIMLQVKELNAAGYGQKDIASKLSMQPFIVGKALKQTEHFSILVLKEALQAAIDTETSIKSGNMDEKMGVEMLLVSYSK